MTIRRILVSTDSSGYSKAAIDYAALVDGVGRVVAETVRQPCASCGSRLEVAIEGVEAAFCDECRERGSGAEEDYELGAGD